ncbi:MAG: hypothetical protein HZA95_02535 [Candidatus Vogelbacteria bacterium]|nr:hypothetical protein [Candidatus Vogelbacteria bacterium]
MKIGFIGQGWIGKNYADNFKNRGYEVVRYSLEPKYAKNKEEIKKCDIVFIAVPTPTTPKGFDAGVLVKVMELVGKKKIAVIKSTILPGTTESIQKQYSDIYVMHSPEFLSERTAKEDVRWPDSHVIGISTNSSIFRSKARMVLSVLPDVPSIICSSVEAEFIKYAHNIHGFIDVVYSNLLYDLAGKLGVEWDIVKKFASHDKYMVDRYMNPVHASGHVNRPGRGAGGHCYIKDFAAFRKLYVDKVGDKNGMAVLDSIEKKNIELLLTTNKDIDLLQDVYGKAINK